MRQCMSSGDIGSYRAGRPRMDRVSHAVHGYVLTTKWCVPRRCDASELLSRVGEGARRRYVRCPVAPRSDGGCF